MNIFEQIIMKGITFNSNKGVLLPQEVAKLPLKSLQASNVTLDTVSKLLLKKMRDSEEESLVNTTASPENEDDQIRKDFLTYVINLRKAEIAAKTEAKAAEEHNSKIDELIRNKRLQEMEGKTIEELEALRK